MASRRVEKMGGRSGLPGLIDRLRYHELSRQGFGLLLLWVCAWFTEPAGEGRIIAGFLIALVGLLVGSMVLSVFLPIFKLHGTLV